VRAGAGVEALPPARVVLDELVEHLRVALQPAPCGEETAASPTTGSAPLHAKPSQTPRRSSSGRAELGSVSPVSSTACGRSATMTLQPCRASAIAAADPAMPAPAIRTSQDRMPPAPVMRHRRTPARRGHRTSGGLNAGRIERARTSAAWASHCIGNRARHCRVASDTASPPERRGCAQVRMRCVSRRRSAIGMPTGQVLVHGAEQPTQASALRASSEYMRIAPFWSP
jgi:hypothetical protein